MTESFWARIFYSEFIKHFRKMTDAEIASDIRESMDALENLDDSGNSLGALMVKSSNKRIDDNRKQRIEAGRKGGKAKGESYKSGSRQREARDESTTSCDVQTDAGSGNASGELTPSENNGCKMESRTSVCTKNLKKKKCRPPTTEALYDYCVDSGLDESDARDCYEMCQSRDWKDRNGNNIVDWKSFTKGFCESRRKKRVVG